jgi:hypothetical protein
MAWPMLLFAALLRILMNTTSELITRDSRELYTPQVSALSGHKLRLREVKIALKECLSAAGNFKSLY